MTKPWFSATERARSSSSRIFRTRSSVSEMLKVAVHVIFRGNLNQSDPLRPATHAAHLGPPGPRRVAMLACALRANFRGSLLPTTDLTFRCAQSAHEICLKDSPDVISPSH